MARLIGAVAAATALILATGCSGGDDDKKTEAGTSGDGRLETVTYLTGAGVLGRESYVHVAMEKGYFKEAGFDVRVQPGKGTELNLTLLQSGAVDFAVLDITAALIAAGQGTKDFTVVSAIHQRNLACFMALSGSGISTPKDLEGKKIAYIPGGIVKTLFDTYAKLAGVDPAKVTWVSTPPEALVGALGSGSVDAVTQFVVGKPQIEKVAREKGGQSAVVLPFSDQLIDLYGNGLGVSKKLMAADPDKVKRFNTAMLRGLEYALQNPDEAAQIYAKYQKTQPVPVASAEMKLMGPYSAISGVPLGSLDEQKVTRNIAALQSGGAIPGTIGPRDVINFDLVTKS